MASCAGAGAVVGVVVVVDDVVVDDVVVVVVGVVVAAMMADVLDSQDDAANVVEDGVEAADADDSGAKEIDLVLGVVEVD